MQGKNVPIECSLVSLEVSNLSATNHVDLPKVYSRPSLPVSSDAVARKEDIRQWPHLNGIVVPQIDAEIGLLIGSDVPVALQPIDIRPSENGGPFASRMIFGWVLNGPLIRRETTATANFVRSTDTSINTSLECQFKTFCNRGFDDSNYEATPSLSQNNGKALKIMEDSIKLENGHYVIDLPWKNYPPQMTNNRSMAEQRLDSLKKRLQREPEPSTSSSAEPKEARKS